MVWDGDSIDRLFYKIECLIYDLYYLEQQNRNHKICVDSTLFPDVIGYPCGLRKRRICISKEYD